ncbi:hypothetical protein [Mumia zhuanghuii]|uniref:Uncharacterized protein n=1 Tax=Mumia zhuanghuii TaxID=2585211 RepID=A0A5C4MVE9_9ACTN|nr:hypothetical protein [Mumia zhuanghuii]TNC49720.1 hypothetical protein FHE65_04825 [Mumia zhuanghuii]TNC49975.1 hypothetical protein FHE65_04630 [Mumia zhuanghuii]
MRAFVSFLLGLGALVMAAVAVPGLWVERNVVDESGYVALASSLEDDAAFRTELATTVSQGVMRGAGIDGVGRDLAEPVVRRVALGMTELSGFDTAWTEVNRESHRINVTDIPPAELDGRLGIDLTPLGTLVADNVNERLGTNLRAPEGLVVTVGTPEQRETLDRVRDAAAWSWAVLGLALVLAVAAVVTARRRGTALIALGIGLVAMAVVQQVLAANGSEVVVDQVVERAGLGRALMEQLRAAVVASYGRWMLVLGAVGAVLAAVGAVVRVRT